MRKNIWVLILSRLLFLQIIHYGVQEIEQRKDVVVPEKAALPQTSVRKPSLQRM